MWLRTVDGELVNLDRCEAITVEEVKRISGEVKCYEVIAHIPSGRVTVASDFSSFGEASQYIRDKIVFKLSAFILV